MNVSITRTIDEFPWMYDFARLEVEAEGTVERCASTSPCGNSFATQEWQEIGDVTVRILLATYGPDCIEADQSTLQGLQAALDRWFDADTDGQREWDSILESLQCQT